MTVPSSAHNKRSMPSLKDVVERMSTETNNSTLGWDVVVNYSCVS